MRGNDMTITIKKGIEYQTIQVSKALSIDMTHIAYLLRTGWSIVYMGDK